MHVEAPAMHDRYRGCHCDGGNKEVDIVLLYLQWHHLVHRGVRSCTLLLLRLSTLLYVLIASTVLIDCRVNKHRVRLSVIFRIDSEYTRSEVAHKLCLLEATQSQ